MVVVTSAFDPRSLPDPPRPGRRGQGRPTSSRVPLSRKRIVDAALAIVDAEGLDALSMRRVATDLGTGPASLYQHVANKDELLELCLDRVASTLELPAADPAHWEEQLKAFVRGLHGALLEHRDLARAATARIPTTPSALVVVEHVLEVLRAGDVPDEVAAWAGELLTRYAVVSAYATGTPDADARFEFGLDVIVRGLAGTRGG